MLLHAFGFEHAFQVRDVLFHGGHVLQRFVVVVLVLHAERVELCLKSSLYRVDGS